nr:serine hydrolase domain-containing protein [Yoonia sp. I 8.24]
MVSAGFGFQQGDDAPQIYVGGTHSTADATPVSVDAAWHIGSITKTFTAALAFMLAQDGLIDLDAPVIAYLSDDAADMDPSWREITLTQVLSHKAGLRPNPDRASMRALYNEALNHYQFLSACWRAPLPPKPGTFRYSNIGYIFAAHVLEAVSGQSWEDLLRNRIVAPLGLASVGIGPPSDLCGHRSFLGLFRRPVAPDARMADNPPLFSPAGRMHLSIPDMLIWGRFLLTAQRGETDLLEATSVQRMMDTGDGDYGAGLMRFQIPGTDYVAWGHDGSNRLWYGLLALVPEKDAVAFVISGEGRINKVAKLGVALLDTALAVKA